MTADEPNAPQREVTFSLDGLTDASRLCGNFDENLSALERSLGVTVRLNADDALVLIGSPTQVDFARRVLERLFLSAVGGAQIAPEDVALAIADLSREQPPAQAPATLFTTHRGREVRPRTTGQREFVDAMLAHTVSFGIGPAGTGKTFLAVVMAMRALKAKTITRIVLTRPAVEAGEKLGFLPGDLREKVDPYLRPLFDAVAELVDDQTLARYLERGTIEVAPLAYMRGRTLAEAFVILDEAQNTTREQLKMFLTRLGHGSRMVVTGDVTQMDLPRGIISGLPEVRRIFGGLADISITELSTRDVVRSTLVSQILEAYERDAARTPQPPQRGAQSPSPLRPQQPSQPPGPAQLDSP